MLTRRVKPVSNTTGDGLSRSSRWLAAFLLMTLSACAPLKQQPVVKVDLPFDEAEHAPFTEKGSQQLRGQAFLLQSGGGNVTCAGRPVLMVPDTPFFYRGIQIAMDGGKPEFTHKPPKHFSALKKDSMCDAQGNFEFDNVPPGKWIVMTQVVWMAGYARQGGTLLKRIEVGEEKSSRIFLTDTNRIGP